MMAWLPTTRCGLPPAPRAAVADGGLCTSRGRHLCYVNASDVARHVPGGGGDRADLADDADADALPWLSFRLSQDGQ